jgi:hypothetical protein
MRGSIKLVAALALMVLSLQPLASCFSSEMTQTDEECCRQMAGDCGQVSMPTSHSCCRYVDRADSARPEAKSSGVSTVPVALISLDSQAFIFLASRTGANIAATAESPPGSPSRFLQALRI